MFGDLRLTWADSPNAPAGWRTTCSAAGSAAMSNGPSWPNHESGQDHLAIYLHNGNEYLEAMLGSLKARVGSLNVNYRYVAEELQYLLADSNARAIVVHSQFAPTLAEVLPALPNLDVILQVPDASGNELLPGAVWYEDALAGGVAGASPTSTGAPTTSTCSTPAAPPACPRASCGATGMPWSSASADRRPPRRSPSSSPRPTTGSRALLAPPFMHGAGHWMSVQHLARRRNGLRPVGSRTARSGRHLVAGRAREAQLPADRGRRLRPPAARRARPQRATTWRRSRCCCPVVHRCRPT